VARRVKVLAPDSPFFAVRRVMRDGSADSSKVAAGMEATYVVTFTPSSTDDYSHDLMVVRN
jgi:hydrocephalus-inducing protein